MIEARSPNLTCIMTLRHYCLAIILALKGQRSRSHGWKVGGHKVCFDSIDCRAIQVGIISHKICISHLTLSAAVGVNMCLKK